MGACLSCLGLSSNDGNDTEHSQLLHRDDPYNIHPGNSYGTTLPGGQGFDSMTPEELKKEQEAMDEITRKAGDNSVDIFPYRHSRRMEESNGDLNGEGSEYQALLAQLPGEKSSKSLRVASIKRPISQASMQSKLNRERTNAHESRVFVKLDMDLT